MSIKSVLLIDANQYINLYQMLSAKKVLAALEEQQDYIFVTEQIVGEVYREKVRKAANFLAEQLKRWEGITFPNHLISTSDASKHKKLREISSKDTKEFKQLTSDLLEQISQSKDEVSKRLAPIFAKAVAHKPEELERARARREHGTPGKATDPLGDQLSWEQLLSQCQSNRRLWPVIANYGAKSTGCTISRRFRGPSVAAIEPFSGLLRVGDRGCADQGRGRPRQPDSRHRAVGWADQHDEGKPGTSCL